MGFEDHLASHEFRRLFFTPYETYLDSLLPSPECYKHAQSRATTATEAPPEVDDHAESLMNEAAHELPVEMATEIDNMDCGVDELGEQPDVDGSAGLHDSIGNSFWVGVDNDGQLKPRLTKVADYVLRGQELEDVSLWDFVAQVDKSYVEETRRTWLMDDDNDDAVVDEDEAPLGPNDSDVDMLEADTHDVLVAPQSAKIRLCRIHCHRDSHVLTVRKPKARYVPVVTGPPLPRRAVEHEKARYSRLMLLLFKPWRTAADLRKEHPTWSDAFEAYRTSCEIPARAKTVVDNMNLVAECKKARDQHMAQHIAEGDYSSTSDIPDDFIENSRAIEHHDLSSGNVEDEVLDSLEHIHDIFSDRHLRTIEGAASATERAEACSLYNFSRINVDVAEGSTQLVQSTFPEEEKVWTKAYKQRRKAWREDMSAAQVADKLDGTIYSDIVAIRSIAEYCDDASRTDAPDVFVGGVSPPEGSSSKVKSDDVATKWTLNKKQSLAFQIITQHADSAADAPPLRMYLGGPAGTGKTRVIEAVHDYFSLRKESARLRVSAFMGVAARNVKGHTLHSLLCLNSFDSGRLGEATHTMLRKIWEGVDFLVIDEISMISCEFLAKLDRALKVATGRPDMGGLNIIYCRDFAQLPPVSERRLFAQINTCDGADRLQLQNALMGQARWKSVEVVVLLTALNRQAGPANVRFGELLNRLRDGACTAEDYKLLQARVVGKGDYVSLGSEWANSTVIVSDNAKRDALNERGATAFAASSGQELHWYYAEDKHKGKPLTNTSALRSYLLKLPSGQTRHLLGRLPLVIGMPVYVGTNFDVESGVTNGARGTVKSIRYRLNEAGERVLLSCIVTINDANGPAMPLLMEKDMPILPESASLSFRSPYNHAEFVTIRRTQLPLSPAFAMTAHKSQGQTLDKVIADIDDTRGIETPYVMLSRVRTIDALLIYGDFDIKCITRNLSEQARRERERLNRLNLKTIIKYGDRESATEARSVLFNLQAGGGRSTDVGLGKIKRELESLKRKRPLPDSLAPSSTSTRKCPRTTA